MKSLINLNSAAKQAIIAITILCVLVLSAVAQKVEPQSQGKMYGDPGFRGEPINLNVVNADIRDILSYITDQYGINFVIDKSVKEIPVTVKVNDVPWNIALDSVLQAQGIGVQVNGSILRVATNETLAAEGELYRQRSKYQLDTAALTTEIIRLNYATAGGGVIAGKTTAGTAAAGTTSVGGSSSNMGGGTSADFGASSGGDGLLPIIRRRLSRRGSIEIDSRSNSLVITDVASNIAAIKQLIAIMDQPEPQVEIEARIVIATRNFSRDIGVQLAAILNGARGSGLAGGSLPGTPTTIGNPLVPNPNIRNDLASTISNTAIGLTTGIFGTAQLSAIISAGEQKGQAKVIATPRVTALNNRSAEIKSGTKIPVTTVQPGSAIGGAAVATTTYVDVPLRLQITPQITDAGTVILNVVAENSSTAAITGTAVPAINTQSMQTQVIVPDGGTTVVGGVLFDDERNSQDRTPGLASIPLLGNLFKRRGVTRNTNEILFFITPRINRPDFASASGNGTPSRSTTILQPVPLDNPPSNSVQDLKPEAPQIILQAPTTTKPEGAPDKP